MINPAYTVEQRILLKVKRLITSSLNDSTEEIFEGLRFDPAGYIRKFLNWQPWSGTAEKPGQQQVIDAYTLALRQQQEKHDYEQGNLALNDLKYWQPGQMIKNWIRVESGNLVGKTKLAAGLFSQFLDCFPSIVYTFAPSREQLNDLLWKEIRADRRKNDLPGEVMEVPRLKISEDRFAVGKATNNAEDAGIERIQGQHHPYLMFIMDEAEGIPDFVFNAIEGMDTGIIVIVLLLANPRTRSSRFHKIASLPYVQNFRISTLTHPNVVSGRQIIPGAATRDWVQRRIEKYCEVVDEHDPDSHTFEIEWLPGKTFRPLPEFFWRVLGIAPSHMSPNTFCPIGRYEAAKNRKIEVTRDHIAQIGADVARYGDDNGTIYCEHANRIWREAKMAQQDTFQYYIKMKTLCIRLIRDGVTDISIRVDAGGGFGGGVIDHFNADLEIAQRLGDFENLKEFQVLEVNFDGEPYDPRSFSNLITEMYYHAGENVRRLSIIDPPDELEADLCERTYGWGRLKGYAVKRLTEKDSFRKDHKRSPDDGDGFVLATAPEHLFQTDVVRTSSGRRRRR